MDHFSHRQRGRSGNSSTGIRRARKAYRYRHTHVRVRGAAIGQGARLLRCDDVARDPLTGLPDRRAFDARLERVLSRRPSSPEQLLAVLFIDVDGFKAVNDRCGHTAGDAVLIELAARLTQCVRPGDLVSRRGGDEFTVLLDGLHDRGDALCVADRILARMQTPCDVEGGQLPVAVSIGIAIRRPGAGRAHDVLRQADEAMYRAKSLGKARSSVYGE